MDCEITLCLSNHDLTNTLVGHLYASRLTHNEKFTLVNMTQSSMKCRNILPTIKERNDKNVTTIKQVYNIITVN